MISLLIILVIVGVLVYFVNAAPFIDAKFKWIINAVIIIATLIWLAEYFGVFAGYGPLQRGAPRHW